jgi:hypothetical protein
LGGKQKGESERVILQREVDQSAATFDVLAFKVLPSQVMSLRTFDFAGLSLSEVDTGVLYFNIISPAATSLSALRALANNNAHMETYYLSGEPTTGALSTADTHRLRNQKGYLSVNWMEARTQMRCTLDLLGSLCGDNNAVPAASCGIMRQYARVEARLQHEIDTEVGAHLGYALFLFNLQLILRECFVDQTRTDQSAIIPAPDFGLYLKAFKLQNNLNWPPSVYNVPALFVLRAAPVRAPNVPCQAAAPVSEPSALVARITLVTERCDLGVCVRSPGRDACFTGNTAFAKNVRARRVEEATSLASVRNTLPEIVREGVSIGVCVSYHGKGSCFEGCIRARSHRLLSGAEQRL